MNIRHSLVKSGAKVEIIYKIIHGRSWMNYKMVGNVNKRFEKFPSKDRGIKQ
jgi:hypothetical protein